MFNVVVVPATWEVHPNTLPKWGQKLRGTNTLSKLMKAYPKLPWVDTRKALLKASKKNNVFVKVNSHWTNYGGYVAWQAIAKCLAGDAGPGQGRRPGDQLDQEGRRTTTSSSCFGVKAGKNAWTVPVLPTPPAIDA